MKRETPLRTESSVLGVSIPESSRQCDMPSLFDKFMDCRFVRPIPHFSWKVGFSYEFEKLLVYAKSFKEHEFINQCSVDGWMRHGVSERLLEWFQGDWRLELIVINLELFAPSGQESEASVGPLRKLILSPLEDCFGQGSGLSRC
ncbi:hypothetical protein RHMOL_Rhmol09G0023000 [Rhododendron molle]|uniref:Uncharacterized protein n=1 Tax=Rhododendron molle TaxID=49168 RepID=A0ACC0M918_RHOML|nr:hypothetical protein RHMOL_Rhmol09G0023000 [Rhododendron molle]